MIVSRELVRPTSAGDPYTVLVAIRNTERGEGEVEAIARLRSTRTQETAAQNVQQVHLSSLETVHIVFKLEAPQNDEYDVIVDTQYPP